MPAQELLRVGLHQLRQLRSLRLMSDEWMNVEELPSVVERLQLVECLQIADAQLHHVHDVTPRRLLVQAFVELLHLLPSDHTIVVDKCGHLYLRIEEIIPVYLRVFFLLLDFTGALLSFFFSLPLMLALPLQRVVQHPLWLLQLLRHELPLPLWLLQLLRHELPLPLWLLRLP